MDPEGAFRQEFEAVLREAAAALGHEADLPSLEVPPDPEMGDLGMPCFPLARTLRRAPAQIAEEMAAAARPGSWIREVRAVGPYVNAFLDTGRLARQVLNDPAAALTAAPKPGRVLLEHTSANPNGPLHVGRARNPVLGDTLARVLRAAGHDVHVQYYMDNLGRQVALLYWGHRHLDEADLPEAQRDKPDHRLVRYYQAAHDRMTADPEVAQEIKALVASLETAPDDLLQEVRGVYERCFEGMRQSLGRLGVTYDSVKDESDLVQDGSVDGVVADLKKTPRAAVEPDGANYLDMGEELEGSKSTKFFFTRKDGSSVYATRDVAYHAWKARQVGPDGVLVDVLGEDHRLQARQVGVALEALGLPAPDVVFYAFVSLPEGKMSTRANRVVFLDDLLDEAVERAYIEVEKRRGSELEAADLRRIADAVGIAAVRFNLARVQPEKPIRFRWEDALDFEGDSAPYIMYAHARAASLLAKAARDGLTAEVHPGSIGEGEALLTREVARFVPTMEEAARRYAPHRAAAYALELAGAFNAYYRDHPVVACEDPALRSTRLAAVQAARQALAQVHEALGLPLLDAM